MLMVIGIGFLCLNKKSDKRSSQGHGFLMSSTNLNRICQKYIYIDDTFLQGQHDNNQTGTGTSGTKYANDPFVLSMLSVFK